MRGFACCVLMAMSCATYAGEAQPWVPTAQDERTAKQSSTVVADDPDIPGVPPRNLRPERLRHLRNDVYAAVTNPRLTWIHVPDDKMAIVADMLGHAPSKAIIGHTEGNDLHLLWYDAVGVIRLSKPFDDEAIGVKSPGARLTPEDIEALRKERLRRIRQMTPLLVR